GGVEAPGALDVGAEDRVERAAGAAGAVVLDGLGERGGGAVVRGQGERVGQQDGGALLGGGVVDEQRGGGAALLGVVQVDDDHVPLLRPGRRGGAGTGAGAGQAGQLPGVPEVADAAGDDQGEHHGEGDDAAAGPAPGLLAALGAVLGELQPVDDVLGVAVRLLDEGELLGAVLRSAAVLRFAAVLRPVAVRGRRVLVVHRAGLLGDVGPLLRDAGLPAGAALRVGLPVGVVRARRAPARGGGLPVGVVGAVRVVSGRLLPGAVRVVGVVRRRVLPGAGGVRVVAVPLRVLLRVRGLRDAGLLLVGVVGAVRVVGGRLLGGLLDRDLPVDRLPVRVVADEFVGRAAPVPRVVSVVHRCPFPLTRRDTARAWRCSARLRPAPGTRRGLPWRLSHGSPWRRWRGRAPRRGRPRPRGARRR